MLLDLISSQKDLQIANDHLKTHSILLARKKCKLEPQCDITAHTNQNGYIKISDTK